MNGIHDLGGMDGFGAVPKDDATFHEDWERVAFALSLLNRLRTGYELDEKRHAVERIDPAAYLSLPYFGRWIVAEEKLSAEKGILDEGAVEQRVAEIEAGEYEVPEREDPVIAAQAREMFESDRFSVLEAEIEPTFESGDDVVVRNQHPRGHTRAPRYARRSNGVVRVHRGSLPLPDAAADGEDAVEPVYSVEFTGRELWGPDGSESDVLHLDLWESYLEPADGSKRNR